jgi:hypothetical protein
MAVKRKTLSASFAIAAGCAMLSLFAGHADADNGHSGTADEQAACTPDVLSLCLFEIPNEDRIVACLNRNLDSLSPACRKVIAGDSPKEKQRAKR